jgi:hypothetical protein
VLASIAKANAAPPIGRWISMEVECGGAPGSWWWLLVTVSLPLSSLPPPAAKDYSSFQPGATNAPSLPPPPAPPHLPKESAIWEEKQFIPIVGTRVSWRRVPCGLCPTSFVLKCLRLSHRAYCWL